MWEVKPMRSEKWGTSLTAFALGCLLAFGSSGSLLTAFALYVEDLSGLAVCWALAALLTVLVLRWKYGGTALVCLLAFLGGYIWRRGIAAGQLWSLIYRISRVYNSAYGWGVLRITQTVPSNAPADWPLGILGCLIGIFTCWRVCRRKSGWPAALFALLPLLLCVVVTDTVPHEIPLFLLMTGILLLLLTGAVRQENEMQGLRLTAMAVFPVALALLTVFLLHPKNNYVNRSETLREELLEAAEDFPRFLETSAQRLASELRGGTTQQIDLGQVGPRVSSSYPVMEVTSRTGGTIYLRGQDFDSYSGTGWNTSLHRTEEFSLPGEIADTISIRTRSRRSLYYIPYYPGDTLTLTEGKMENDTKEKEYRFSVTALPENWRQMTISGNGSGESLAGVTQAADLDPYLTLPASTRRDALPLLEGMLSGTNTEMAHRIAAMVCGSARYDLDTPAMPDGETDFALWFLREGETGYCVHFATAATVLLRSAGVPARYVTGYMVDTHPGKTVTATEEDAHAWAEYYEPLLGTWIVLEATPSAGPENSPAETRAPVILPADSPELLLPENPSEETEATQPEPEGTAPVLPAADPVKLTFLARVLILLAAAILISGIQRSTRLQLRRRIQRTGTPNEQALARWRETELLCRLLKESPDENLTALAQKAKFSPHDLTAEELAQFDSRNRACLRQLRGQSWYRRLLHQYIYAIY